MAKKLVGNSGCPGSNYVRFLVSGAAAFLLLIPSIPAPTSGSDSLSEDRKRRVEVLYTGGAEPAYVADALRIFGANGALNFHLGKVASASVLVERVRESTADLLIVAAHGSRTAVGPSRGLDVGDTVLSRGDLMDAIRASGAKRFFIAACSLDLPAESAGRPIRSFPDAVDAKLAVLAALSAVGELYDERTQLELLPLAEAMLDSVGTPEELVVRAVHPVNPLKAYDCERNHCEHDAADEQRVQERGQRDSGAVFRPGSGLDRSVPDMVQFGFLKLYGPGTYQFGTYWDFLLVIDSQCQNLFSLKKLILPGYQKVQIVLVKVYGVTISLDADVFVKTCTKVYGGFERSSRAVNGAKTSTGVFMLQAGAKGDVNFTFGRQVIKRQTVEWMGIDFSMSLRLTGPIDSSCGCAKKIYVDVRTSFTLPVKVEFGWGSGSIVVGDMDSGWNRVFAFNNPFANSAAPNAGPATGVEEVQEILMTIDWSRALRNALAHYPPTATRLSQALGRNVFSLPLETPIDLGDPAVFRALYGDDHRGPATLVHPPLPPPQATADSSGACPGQLDVGEPVGPVEYWACLTSDEVHATLEASVSVAGRDRTGYLLDAVGARPWVDQYGSLMGDCHSIIPPQYWTCHQAAGSTTFLPGLAKSRIDDSSRVDARVDVSKDLNAIYVRICADGLPDSCGTGAGGVANSTDVPNRIDIPGASGTPQVSGWPVEVVTTTQDASRKGGRLYRSLDAGTLAHDVCEWEAGLSPPGSQPSCA